jgi:hypothetical protein
VSEQRPSNPLATPKWPGKYSSTCLTCKRQMEWADKRCRICVDCYKEPEQLSSKTLLDRLEKATCDGDLYMGTRDLFQDAIDEIERLQWVYTSSALPEKGRKVLFELSGDPGKPIIGYFDDKGSWKERTGKEYATDWDCWWTDLHDEDDWWEHKHVTRWCYVPEMP